MASSAPFRTKSTFLQDPQDPPDVVSLVSMETESGSDSSQFFQRSASFPLSSEGQWSCRCFHCAPDVAPDNSAALSPLPQKVEDSQGVMMTSLRCDWGPGAGPIRAACGDVMLSSGSWGTSTSWKLHGSEQIRKWIMINGNNELNM